MKTFVTKKTDNCILSFEVENIYISKQQIARLLRKVDEVTDVRVIANWFGGNDVRLIFRFRQQSYIVWEPYGDNSRYWIGPESLEDIEENGMAPLCINSIEAHFGEYRPHWARRIIGDLLTMRFLKG